MNKMDENGTSIVIVAKIGAMVGLGFCSLLLGMTPLIVGRCRANQSVKKRGLSSVSSRSVSTNSTCVDSTHASDSKGLPTSLLLCFGGGVLLFTTFLHLAPEVRTSVERHQSNDQLPDLGSLSLADLLFCFGFFLVYLVEEAVHAALRGKPESSDALLYRTVSVRRCNSSGANATNTTVESNGSSTTLSTITKSTWSPEIVDNVTSSNDDKTTREEKQLEHPNKMAAIFVMSAPKRNGTDDQSGNSAWDDSNSNLKGRERDVRLSVDYPRLQYSDNNNGEVQNGVKMNSKKESSVQGLLTVLALSFHAIFEGLAVGLEPSLASVIYLAAAIATHKLVISFCVGMELYVAGATTRTTLAYLTVFSMVTPIGIAAGLALGYFKNDSDNLGPTPTILQGMAAGTLLYVVFFEVLARERANEKSGLLQLLAILFGFLLMLGLQVATAHSHSHSHGHGHSHESGAEHEHGMENEARSIDEHNHTLADKRLNGSVITEVIERTTESIAEAVSHALSSQTQNSHLHSLRRRAT
ncbi:zinc transporter ZIP3-like isoform X1 [Prorops nasuta]|uniref:zinc transporter ZIP3-like isoform X1 n=1 Tax=Prorops nasuta TaxID=863751 RepID=UPI0034CEDEA7